MAALGLINNKRNFDLSKQCIFEDSAHLTKKSPLVFPSDLPQWISNKDLNFKNQDLSVGVPIWQEANIRIHKYHFLENQSSSNSVATEKHGAHECTF